MKILTRKILIIVFITVLIIEKSFGSNFNNDKPAILFIHGLGGTHAIWNELINNLPDQRFSYVGNLEYKKSGINFTQYSKYNSLFPCFTMDFSENQNLSFDEQAKIIQEIIKKIEHITTRNKIILFGHSMGGLAARAYINTYGNNKVGGLVTVGTPTSGLLSR